MRFGPGSKVLRAVTSASNLTTLSKRAWTCRHKPGGLLAATRPAPLAQIETGWCVMTHSVVVGVDGSPAAAAALAWAAGEARLRDVELVAWTIEDRSVVDTGVVRTPDTAYEELTGGYPLTMRHGHGDAATGLVAACADADLLVVGSRGRTPLAELVLGSVSRACVTRAPCPVVVVRPQPEQASPRGRVAVGVDLSGHSRQALRAAAAEARLRDAALDVVHAVHWQNIGTELLTPTPEQLVEWGQTLVAAELAATEVAGRPVVVHGYATAVLVRQSADADLLVVGSRGRGPVTGLLLGSTSEHCVRHAHCPVMVTRVADEQASAEPTQTVVHGEVAG
jgi:nucleotide-binding universal stress UspA family protein